MQERTQQFMTDHLGGAYDAWSGDKRGLLGLAVLVRAGSTTSSCHRRCGVGSSLAAPRSRTASPEWPGCPVRTRGCVGQIIIIIIRTRRSICERGSARRMRVCHEVAPHPVADVDAHRTGGHRWPWLSYCRHVTTWPSAHPR